MSKYPEQSRFLNDDDLARLGAKLDGDEEEKSFTPEARKFVDSLSGMIPAGDRALLGKVDVVSLETLPKGVGAMARESNGRTSIAFNRRLVGILPLTWQAGIIVHVLVHFRQFASDKSFGHGVAQIEREAYTREKAFLNGKKSSSNWLEQQQIDERIKFVNKMIAKFSRSGGGKGGVLVENILAKAEEVTSELE